MIHQSEQQNNINDAFEFTLKDSNLQKISSDILEIGIDSLLDDDVLKSIPIVNTATGLLKFGANIQDHLFLKKIIAFLYHIKEISSEKRKIFIESIDKSKKYRVRVGEKLLYIIDSCEDFEIAELVGRVFKYYLEGCISYDEFLKTSSVLKDMNKVDFDWFLKNGKKLNSCNPSDIGDLVHTGLFELYYEQIDISI